MGCRRLGEQQHAGAGVDAANGGVDREVQTSPTFLSIVLLVSCPAIIGKFSISLVYMNLSLECWLIELDEPGGKVKSDPDFETIRSIMLHEIKRLQKHTMIDSSMIAIRDVYQ